MKRNVKHFLRTKISVRNLIFTTVILLFSGLNASAQQSSHQVNFKNGSISYQGAVDESLVFKLNVQNNIDSKIAVIILDENGERIFRGTFRGKKIGKLFKVPVDSHTFTFIISNPGEKSVQQFKISTEHRYVEDVTITKKL